MTIIKIKKVFRNNICDCGSGKKIKNCCKSESEYQIINNSVNEETPIDNNSESGDNA